MNPRSDLAFAIVRSMKRVMTLESSTSTTKQSGCFYTPIDERAACALHAPQRLSASDIGVFLSVSISAATTEGSIHSVSAYLRIPDYSILRSCDGALLFLLGVFSSVLLASLSVAWPC